MNGKNIDAYRCFCRREQRVFDVSVNGEKLIDSLNLADSYGEQTAVVKTLVVNVRNHEGLEILLSPQKGQGVISGLKVRKYDDMG